MKKEEILLDAMGYIGEDMLKKSETYRKNDRKVFHRVFALIAACVVFAVMFKMYAETGDTNIGDNSVSDSDAGGEPNYLGLPAVPDNFFEDSDTYSDRLGYVIIGNIVYLQEGYMIEAGQENRNLTLGSIIGTTDMFEGTYKKGEYCGTGTIYTVQDDPYHIYIIFERDDRLMLRAEWFAEDFVEYEPGPYEID